ncbi:MAG: secretin N-terminal domain-containing protein [Verrucomicrobiales bacterium]
MNSGNFKSILFGALIGGSVIAAVFVRKGATPALAQAPGQFSQTHQAAASQTNPTPATPAPAPAEVAKTNAVLQLSGGAASASAPTNTNAVAATAVTAPATQTVSGTNAPVVAAAGGTNAISTASTNLPPGVASATSTNSANEDIQLSFQGANVDMVIQWLAKTTGKSVVKHPRVQCQLNIVSSKPLPQREALNLVYRALALEGFSVVETSKSITVVPEGSEPKVSPEIIDSDSDVPEGRQRLVKFFTLKHAQPAELRDKIKTVLSEKATVELADRSNQIIVTDWADNIRMLGEMIKELDVPSGSDTVIEFFPLKYSEAEELGNLLTLVLNAQPAPARSASTSSSSGSRTFPGMPPGMSMGPPPSSPSPSSAPSGGGAGNFKIWPDKTSNRLIVAAPKEQMPEVQRLIDLMDTEKQLDYSIRTLPLKNVSAEDLVREIAPLYQKMASKGKESVEVSANSRSNSLIIMSSEAQFRAIEKLIESLDTEEAQEKVMQVFELRNADAEEVAKQITDLNQDQDAQSRNPYIFFSSSMSQKSTKKINVVADKRRNSLMVQAPPSQMEGIGKLIAELDEPITDDSLAPRIYRLKYVSAVDIEDVLNELFTKKAQQQQRMYWDPYSSFGQDDTRDSKGGRLFGKVRIISEPYSNSILVSGNSPEAISAVEDVLEELDVPSQAGESTLRVNLNFANANTVASSINILFAKPGSPPLRGQGQGNQPNENRQPPQPGGGNQNVFQLEQEVRDESYYPWLGGQQENNFRGADGRNTTRPVSDLVGRVRVVPDKRSNALLVTCNLHFFPQVMKLISDLDAPTSQVLIEAKIVEVSSDFRDKLGVRWSPDGSQSFDRDDLDNSFMVKTGASYQEVFQGNKLAESLRTGVLDTSINVDFLVQFLRKNTGSKVLAEPQLNIADNELGRLFVGAQVPFISGSLNTDVGGRNDTFTYKDVGIILEVTPHINNSEEVALKIRTESSTIRSGETLFGGAIIDTRNFRTDVMAKNGETIVLGGIIQRDQVDTTRKVPGLGSIPGLGWAFKKRDKLAREVEMMVFLTPRVTRTPEQARELLQAVKRKAPLIQNWQDESEAIKLPKDAQPKDVMPPTENKK